MAGPPVRGSYNAKARQATAGSRKKGKAKRKSLPKGPMTESDPNAEILTLKSQDDKDKEKRRKMLEELAAQSESTWNSKKKKRLEKYIDKKLKNEERVLIFEKLAKTQASMSSSVLQSSSTLGTRKALTHNELQEKAEDHLVKKSFNSIGKRKRHQDIFAIQEYDEDVISNEELGISEKISSKEAHVPSKQVDTPTSLPSAAKSQQNSVVVGSALQKNSDGSILAPKVRLRSKSRKATVRSWGKSVVSEVQLDSDTSFDSSDSENDSTDDEETAGVQKNEDKQVREDSEQGDEDLSEEEPGQKKTRLNFKDWALKQLSAAKGHDFPTSSSEGLPKVEDGQPQPPRKRRKLDEGEKQEFRGPLGEELKIVATPFALQAINSSKRATSGSYVKAVEVKRLPEVEEARTLLPIVTEEHPIMEAILLNPVVIVCGETGSGKTTQVPQFLYEAGFGTPGSENPGMIGITQPRRVAAMSMAARVAHELSLTSSRVSYQIRYDATVSPETSIKFMTDGVLLRELATDFLLTKYSVVIIDEAHERSINTDILIGVLSRVIKLREDMWRQKKDGAKPLRLIIMSATLRVSDFAENKTLFSSPPPIINVAARQHPVTVHFSRRTYPDYVSQAIKKTLKIHTRLPPGGILIFLTGQNEITGVCRKLKARYGQKSINEKLRRRAAQLSSTQVDEENFALPGGKKIGASLADVEVEEIELDNFAGDNLALDVDENMDHTDPEALESDDDEQLNQELGLVDNSDTPMHIIPLYSLLPSEKQMLVFQSPPPGHRLVVVSTNIAETSLTIPGIRYVVDCGRAKERCYDEGNGIQSFRVSWIAKASAAQRAGRAGRTGPGHCYRLFSSALFENHFAKFSTPEVQRMPIEGVVLQMKSMHIDAVVNFPFPTPPERLTLCRAEKTLCYLGALTPSVLHTPGKEGQLTDLGRAMSLFPLSPRFSRMLVTAHQYGCLPYAICIVSALSVGDPFIYEDALLQDEEMEESDMDLSLNSLNSDVVRVKEARRRLRKAYFESQHTHASLGKYTSDIFKLLSVIGAYEYAGNGHKFCSDHFVRPKAMEEVHKLRAQISNIVHSNFPGTDSNFTPEMPPPSERQLKALRQILAAGFIDQVAVRKDLVDEHESSGTKYSTSKGIPYRALGLSEDVFIHASSIFISSPPPEYLVYHEVVRTSRVFLKGLTVVNPAWLSSLGKDTLCTFSKPTKNNIGILMTIPKFGPDGWELPAVKADTTKQQRVQDVST